MQRALENGWDPYLIQKKHMVADRHDKSARWSVYSFYAKFCVYVCVMDKITWQQQNRQNL